MKFVNYFLFMWVFLPSWIQIRTRIANPEPDPGTPSNPDPQHRWILFFSCSECFCEVPKKCKILLGNLSFLNFFLLISSDPVVTRGWEICGSVKQVYWSLWFLMGPILCRIYSSAAPADWRTPCAAARSVLAPVIKVRPTGCWPPPPLSAVKAGRKHLNK